MCLGASAATRRERDDSNNHNNNSDNNNGERAGRKDDKQQRLASAAYVFKKDCGVDSYIFVRYAFPSGLQKLNGDSFVFGCRS